jgi:hypothetical protein
MAKRSKLAKAKQGLGRKLDSVLFGITPEYRRSLGFKNPAAKRRAVYRAGFVAGTSARKNPARDISDVLAQLERTKLFKDAAAGDLAVVREFYLAGYHDGMGEKVNPTAIGAMRTRPKKAGRKLEAAIKKGDAAGKWPKWREKQKSSAERYHAKRREDRVGSGVDWRGTDWRGNPRRAKAGKKRAARNGALRSGPFVVLVDGKTVLRTESWDAAESRAVAEKRKGHKVHIGEKVNPAKKSKRNPRNPLDTAEAAFEGFHGEKAKHTFKLQDKRHVHDVVWALGPLVYLKVWLPTDRRVPGLRNFVEIEFDYEGKNSVYVTANEKRNQMFFDGGDQSVTLKTFGVPPERHETVVLGEVSDAYYFTTKKHLGDQGGTAIYKHKLGEEGGELPTLIYHCIEKRLSLAGGSYTIPNEGVRN